MQIPTSVWIAVAFALVVNKFGLGVCLTFIAVIIACLAGALSMLCLLVKEEAQEYHDTVLNHQVYFKRTHLDLVTESMAKAEDKLLEPPASKDKRLTGSREIDEPLQEVLGYIFQDYINSWYSELSDDSEFLDSVRQSAQETIITLVTRMKDIDWMPYLTTRLVDDAASHLRLYRQAKAKVKEEIAADLPAKKLHDLEKHFFDFEFAMEQKQLCHDTVCLDIDNLSYYLQDISEIILFLLLPQDDFECLPMRMLLRDLLANAALLPLFELLAEPHFINQTIISLAEIRGIAFSSELFLNVLRQTDKAGELIGVSEILNKDIARLRSCDLGLDDDRSIKQHLSSLLYAKKIIDQRLKKLQEGSEVDSAGVPTNAEWKQMVPSSQLIVLPLEVLLRNNIALSYFIDFMMSIGAQSYLYFYLNVEGWRASAEQQLSDLQLQTQALLDTSAADPANAAVNTTNLEALQAQMLDNMKSAAKSIYEQYLSEKACPRLVVNEAYIARLLDKMTTEFPCETWFDEIHRAIYETLKTEERFLPAFRQSWGYIKLLVELELIKDPCRSDDEDAHSLENLSDAISQSSQDDRPDVVESHDITKEVKQMLPPFLFKAEITETGIANDHGNKYGVYSVSVVKHYVSSSQEESWYVCRRYSDFLNLYQKIKDRYEDLGKIPFPSKKAFHNTERATLERRMRELNSWLQLLLGQLASGASDKYPDTTPWLIAFMQQGEYEQQAPRHFAKAVEQLFMKPIKSSLRTVSNVVRAVPETMSRAIQNRASRLSSPFEASKVGASLDVEANDNIPLRIMLLLLDEVFDLKSRNQWLRRRIINIVRQIIKGMFGDIVNRRIVDYVTWLTSPARVATYIEFFRDTFWPDGIKAEPEPPRTEGDKMRARVLAKMALLASMTDEIKRIMGTETTRRGLLLVFELFQQPVLNRRLSLVLFEGILVTLFPEHNFPETLKKLHSLSERTKKCASRK